MTEKSKPDAASQADAVLLLTGNSMTSKKVKDLLGRGYVATGVVLSQEGLGLQGGERRIVDLAAVRSLSNDEMWALMHPPIKQDINDEVYSRHESHSEESPRM